VRRRFGDGTLAAVLAFRICPNGALRLSYGDRCTKELTVTG
jgi:hypothetical protein